MKHLSQILTIIIYILTTDLQPISGSPHVRCTCQTEFHDNDHENYSNNDHHKAASPLVYKLAAIATILVSSFSGVSIPLFLKNVPALRPERPLHFLVRAFAAGVILATGFIHILPDAFESLTSPCVGERPLWGGFPLAGLVAMAAATGTMMMETFATSFHRRVELRKALPVTGDEEEEVGGEREGGVHVGHVHGVGMALDRSSGPSDLIRYRIISQVLELGIVVHSVIIGISLGATQRTKTIKPLIAALSFHQFFEGMGLGGCISQAKFKNRAMTIMVLFFSLTTPSGIAMGIGISRVYNEYSPTALIVEGVLNSASAGILIYMALVDLLAADFTNSKLQANFRLQLGANVALLLGASCMSLLANWGGS